MEQRAIIGTIVVIGIVAAIVLVFNFSGQDVSTLRARLSDESRTEDNIEVTAKANQIVEEEAPIDETGEVVEQAEASEVEIANNDAAEPVEVIPEVAGAQDVTVGAETGTTENLMLAAVLAVLLGAGGMWKFVKRLS